MLVAASVTACSAGFAACASQTDSSSEPRNDGGADPSEDAHTIVIDAEAADSSPSGTGTCLGSFVMDKAFGGQGVHHGQDTYARRSIFIAEDDRIVAATGDAIVTRLLPNGMPDPSFGNAGEVSMVPDVALAIANAGSGRTLVITGNATVTRLDVSGQLDATFGSGGKTTVATTGTSITAAVVRPTGEVLLVGSKAVNTSARFFVSQLTPGGAIDPSFVDGTPVPVSAAAYSTSLALQADGKLVVGGTRDIFTAETGPPSARALMFARYLMDGSLDPTFGTAGELVLAPAASPHLARMRVLSSGAISFVMGDALSEPGFVIGRLTASGTLDAAFGNGGFTTVDFEGFYDHARDLIPLPDDKVLVGGSALPPGKSPFTSLSFAFVRLDQHGVLDTTFADAGTLQVPVGSGPQELESMAFQSTGALVVSSTRLVTVVPYKHDFFRLNCK